MNIFSFVVENNLCTGCGACYVVCPSSAIKLRMKEDGFLKPVIDHGKCRMCSLCIKVCPSINNRYVDVLNTFNYQNYDDLVGKFIDIYIGHALNSFIRYNASSGGVVTALLVDALEKREIDGAIVTYMRVKNGLLFPYVGIATKKEDILKAMGSKYLPVPLVTIFKTILKEKNDKKYALVGLPCHIRGYRKLVKIYPELQRKIKFTIGLLCGGQPSILATYYILWRYNVDFTKLINLRYRGEGWPGSMKISLINGKAIKISYEKYYGKDGFGAYFVNTGCRICADHTAEYADLSVGDPWIRGYKDQVGSSIIVTRTQIGESIVRNAAKNGVIALKRIPLSVFKASMIEELLYRKTNSELKCKILGLRRIPLYSYVHQISLPFRIYALMRTILYDKVPKIVSYRYKLRLLPLYHNILVRPLMKLWKIYMQHSKV